MIGKSYLITMSKFSRARAKKSEMSSEEVRNVPRRCLGTNKLDAEKNSCSPACMRDIMRIPGIGPSNRSGGIKALILRLAIFLCGVGRSIDYIPRANVM